MDGRAWGYGPWGCKESDMTEQLHIDIDNRLVVTIWGWVGKIHGGDQEAQISSPK